MKKILNISSAPEIRQNYIDKKIILTGGCFDILHQGHIEFLKKAKKLGDILIVFIESDENIKSKKGEGRPFNSQENRSIVLSHLKFIDHIIMLEGMTKTEEYDKLIVQINPDVIVITDGDKYISKRKEQCNLVGAKLEIIKKISSPSTTELIKNFKNGKN